MLKYCENCGNNFIIEFTMQQEIGKMVNKYILYFNTHFIHMKQFMDGIKKLIMNYHVLAIKILWNN